MASYKHINMAHKTAPLEQLVSHHTTEKIEGSDDLLTKILLLLPARPLFRFKLVSKRWLSLISDPRFSSLWRPKAFPSALILEVSPRFYYIPDTTKSKAIGFLDFIKDDPFDDTTILNSCGGLILCRNWSDKYIVCNPTTKEFNTLPSPNVDSLDISLAFDYSISPHYKVISVGHGLHIEIYSSETNSWRQSRAQIPEPFQSYLVYEGVFFKGAIFWTLVQLNSFCYFDIDREIIHSYPMPKMDRQYYFGCVHGNLHLVGYLVSESHQIVYFELGNDYSSWSLKYRIDRRELTSCAKREMVYSTRCPGDSSFIEFTFTVLSLMARKGNQKPYLDIYIPRKVESFPLVHHLIENPFWIGNKLNNIDQ